MNREEFKASLIHEEPPNKLTAPLMALWWDAKQAWSRAHALVDELDEEWQALVEGLISSADER